MRTARNQYKEKVAFECHHKNVMKLVCEVYTPASGKKREYAGFLPNGTDKMEKARLCWCCLNNINHNENDSREAFYGDDDP